MFRPISSLRAAMPQAAKDRYRAMRAVLFLAMDCAYDFLRFARFSAGSAMTKSLDQEDADITRSYHSLEKGLSLKNPRQGFGEHAVLNLCRLIGQRMAGTRPWTQACQCALNALTSYVAFHRQRSFQSSLIEQAEGVVRAASARGYGPTDDACLRVTREAIAEATAFNAAKFFRSRHSVRQFAEAPLDRERLLQAIELGSTAPSVCNRQSTSVMVAVKGEVDMSFLRLQNGNRGFGDSAQAILVVTSDLSAFLGPDERYQCWIDGGMFAMNLVLALHAHNFGTCCLNWSQRWKQDVRLRRELGLPASHQVIMLIAVGEIPPQLPVARSWKRPVSEFMSFYRGRSEERQAEDFPRASQPIV